MIPTLAVLGFVVNCPAFNLNLTCAEVALEIAVVLGGIPQTPFYEVE